MTLRYTQMLPVVAVALALTGLHPAALGQESFNLKRTYKAGDADRYRMNAVIDGEAMKVSTALIVSEKVKEIKPDGSAVLVLTIEAGTIEVNGQTMPFPQSGQSVTSTVDKSGKLIKREGRLGGMEDILSSSAAGMPDRPLKAGDVIKTEVPLTEGKDAKKATVTLTIVGKEKGAGDLPVDTVKVTTAMTRPIATAEGETMLTVAGTAYMEPGTGKALKMEGTVKGTLPAPIGKATVTFKRVRIGEKDGLVPGKPADKPTSQPTETK